jgi:hypothetical protein
LTLHPCAGIPFIALIAITSSCAVYFIAGLNLSPFSRFVYFVLDLFMALLTVRASARPARSVYGALNVA